MEYRIYVKTTSKQTNMLKNLYEKIDSDPFFKTNYNYVQINFTKTKMRINFQDNISSIYIEMDANKFEVYNCLEEKIILLTNIAFIGSLKTAFYGDSLILYMNDDYNLNIEILHNNLKSKIEINLLEVGKQKNIYDLKDKCINFQCMYFQHVVNSIANFSPLKVDIKVSLDNGNITLESEKYGKKIFNISSLIKENDFIVIDDKNSEYIGKYILVYLQSFCKLFPTEKITNIFLKKDSPMLIEYQLPDVEITLCLFPS